MENTQLNLHIGHCYKLTDKLTGDVFEYAVLELTEDMVSFDNNGATAEYDIEMLLEGYDIEEIETPVNPTDDVPEGIPEIDATDISEPAKTNSKNFNIEHQLTETELIKIADEQNTLIAEKIKLEKELKDYKDDINPKIKSKESRIEELNTQYETKTVTRIVTVEAQISWDDGVMRYFNPENNELLEEVPMPLKMKQGALTFTQDIPKNVEEIDKDVWFDYFKCYQGIEFPKGVTPKRIDKAKDDIINSEFFITLCTQAKGSDGSKGSQDAYATKFLDNAKTLLTAKGIIKI